MATELGKAYVQIIPSAQGISGKISSLLKGESKSAGESSGQTLGTSLVSKLKGVVAVAAIGKAIASSLKEGANLQQSLGGIETLFKGHADKVKQYAQESYKTVGVSANEYMENVTSFSASLLQSLNGDTAKAADIANMAMIDMGDNANKMGTDMGLIQNAYQGFSKQNYTMLDNLKLGYGGTRSEMLRLLADAEKLTGVKYDINNLSDVYEAIHVIQTELGITGTTAKEAMETLTGSFNSMKSAFKNVLGSLAIGENVKESFSALAETISTFVFDNLIPMIGNIFKSLPEGVLSFVQTMGPILIEKGGELLKNLSDGYIQALPAFWTNLGKMTDGLGPWVQTQLPILLQHGVKFIKGFISGFLKGLPDAIRGFGEVLTNVVDAVMKAIPQIMQAGADIIVALGEGLIEHGPEILSAIVEVINNVTKAIQDNWPAIVEKGKELIGKLVEGIKAKKDEAVQAIKDVIQEKIKAIQDKFAEFKTKAGELVSNIKQGIEAKKNEAIQAVKTLIQEKIKAIQSKFSEFKTKGSELITKIKEGFIQKKNDVVNAGKQIIEEAKQTIANFKNKFIEVGSHIIQGIADGIKAGIGKITSAARDAAQKALNAAKSMLGIHSPSRVFRDEVGSMIPEGMAIGIASNLKPVEKAMNEMTNATTAEFTKDLAFNMKSNSFKADDLKDVAPEDKPHVIYLSMGGKVFKAFVDSITTEQNQATELELAY